MNRGRTMTGSQCRCSQKTWDFGQKRRMKGLRMPDILDIPVRDLLVDGQNPRLSQANQGDRETLRALAQAQDRKLQFLAEDVCVHGINPSELPIVMLLGDGSNKYVVLEGNRRLTALKALENPDLLVGAVSQEVVDAIRRMAVEYQKAPILEIPCVIVEDRDKANHWIELKHTGENDGAGSVQWGSDESDRFRARTGRQPNLATQVLDFLEARGLVTPEQRRVAPTTLTRIFSSPALRAKVGLEYSKGIMMSVGDHDQVANALVHIVTEVSDRRLTVNDVRTKEQRGKFAAGLPADLVVSRTLPRGQGVSLSIIPAPQVAPSSATNEPRGEPERRREPRPREHLVPHDCTLRITNPRIQGIERELRRLSINSVPNAVGVLLRVFIELSLDEFADKESLQISRDSTLRNKLQRVTKHLVDSGRLSDEQARPVRRAAQGDSFLSPSLTVMNDWVHNQYAAPEANVLRTYWDNLQPFVQSIWSP